MSGPLLRLGNLLYVHAWPLYAPLYAAWKARVDRRERALLSRWIEPGMVVADVGANVGEYTRFLSRRVGPGGRVHAFEPSPSNFARLRERAGGLANATLVEAAVGERSGTIRLYESDRLNVDHRTFDTGEGRRSLEVAVVALDDHFPPGGRVDVIKIDVQGHELAVLRGARRVLADNPRIRLLLEYWPHGLEQSGTAPGELLALLAAHGFAVRAVDAPDDRPFDGGGLDATRAADYRNLAAVRATTDARVVASGRAGARRC